MSRITPTPVPTIAGTGVRVLDVARASDVLKYEPTDVARKYGVTVDDVEAAMEYYHAHPEAFRSEGFRPNAFGRTA